MHFHHGFGDEGRGANPAQAEAGHRVGLGEATKEDRALLHPGQRSEAYLLDAVDEAVIDLGSRGLLRSYFCSARRLPLSMTAPVGLDG
jgi:hypothetical protein